MVFDGMKIVLCLQGDWSGLHFSEVGCAKPGESFCSLRVRVQLRLMLVTLALRLVGLVGGRIVWLKKMRMIVLMLIGGIVVGLNR